MLAKLTSKNQLTLPKAALEAIPGVEYFEIETRAGTLVLTPVRIQRADAVRAKLADLGIAEPDVLAAVAWSRKHVQEPSAPYRVGSKSRKTASKATQLSTRTKRSGKSARRK